VYQEVQVAGASKGADAPVGGSFNNFIVKSGGNKIHGLGFYDREPLKLQGSNLSDALIAQGVTNTSSVARYQSFHADAGGPFIRTSSGGLPAHTEFDSWTPGYVNANGPADRSTRPAEQRGQAELPAQFNHTLAYSAVGQQSPPSSGASAFVD
jgi:hypothetical protein